MPSPELISNETNTVTDILRGRVHVGIHYIGESVFADVRTGSRIARTGMYDSTELGCVVSDILGTLGFNPQVTEGEMSLI